MDFSTSHPAQIERLQRGTRKPPRTFASLGIDQRRAVLSKFIELAEGASNYRLSVLSRAVYTAAQQRLSDYIAGRPDVVRRSREYSSLGWARLNQTRMDERNRAIREEAGR